MADKGVQNQLTLAVGDDKALNGYGAIYPSLQYCASYINHVIMQGCSYNITRIKHAAIGGTDTLHSCKGDVTNIHWLQEVCGTTYA
jgi:hypothetical protein